MDINGLHDDLLVKILSFLPTEVAVSTCVLSKRWEFLWMWLPNLEFTPLKYPMPEFWEFINKKLPLHKALVIETLRLDTAWSSYTKPKDIKRLIDIAVSRHVRELDIEYYCSRTENLFLLETESSSTNGKCLQQLLSNCPVLGDLSVDFSYIRTLREFTIIVPSLQSLSLFLQGNWNLNRYEIDTPSLKYLKLVDWNNEGHYSLIKNMPMLREAYVDNESINPKSVIGSITSVKRLTICCSEIKKGTKLKLSKHKNKNWKSVRPYYKFVTEQWTKRYENFICEIARDGVTSVPEGGRVASGGYSTCHSFQIEPERPYLVEEYEEAHSSEMEWELPEARDTPSTQVERLEENQVTSVPPLSVQATEDYETMEPERPEVTDTPSTQFEDYETTDTPSTQVTTVPPRSVQVTTVPPRSVQVTTVPPRSVQATEDYETVVRELPEVERLEENQVTNVTQSDQASKGRGKRIKKPNVLFQDFVLLTPGVTVKKVTRKKVTRRT
ncbi:uncharacterized protein LOC9306905 [Arabidopsis lyrata subsp. lyrata]|nr:uncharacterized protein LOC9306905 [Arabidopsis lyrata subsp. lyrata]|eukprot:XP_002868766.2 uncharacterized protein LOC9306905 [Arabidopsis lyrata subsp. lyrata]